MTENNIQRHFCTSRWICSKKDDQSVPANEISQKAAKTQGRGKETLKKDLLDVLKDMKVELSTVNVKTTKPRSGRLTASLETAAGRLQEAPGERPKKRNEFLSPELVAAAAAVADSLPFDKQTTKSELLRQLQQHEEESRAQKDGEKRRVSFTHIISNMKIAKSASGRVSRRPQHQIQFDEGMDSSLDQEKPTDLRRSHDHCGYLVMVSIAVIKYHDQKQLGEGNLYSRGKDFRFLMPRRLLVKHLNQEAPPSLWEIEFAKQLATVNEQPFANGFEEMIQWTKEGKLWEFPVNNEAGLDDDGSEFHEHIFLDKYLEDFPKQGPIRVFMELVTCGLSKNPYLSVKQKVEHIEWFRNYFNEKRDILKENNVMFT
ncbi:28S ribosomal protein S31, mitochondrial [Apodemus speciosus]|uniref:Small ribosomal subunit protein mS31 n=1 Tax=Apodemus speciosus TaxID=105296 RepID=A0ABQ0F168_APOSI